MSAAPPANAGATAPAKGNKKMIVIVMLVLLLAAAGGGAMMFMKKKASADGDAVEETSYAGDHGGGDGKPDLKHPPTFLPLDPFVINLADKDADRYAQIGITIEVSDAHFAEEMKAFMPAIRNGILMILAHKSSKELLERAGKEQLADEILRDASRTMGIEVEDPDDDEATDANQSKAKPKKKKRRRAPEPNPIKHVHFSNFIVQ
jgi:flagellar FliL protein